MFGTCVTLHRVGSLPGVISWRRLKIFRWASGLWGMFGDCLDYSLIIIYIWCPGYSWITILTAVFASSQPSHGAASIFRGGWTNKLGQFGGYQITFYAALILWWWWTFPLTSSACETRMEMNELLIEFLPRHNTVPLTLSPAQRCDPFSEAGTKNTELNIRLASQFPTLLRYPNFNIKLLLLWDEASKYKNENVLSLFRFHWTLTQTDIAPPGWAAAD